MEYIFHKADERGVSEQGWLHTKFSFSFAHWYNPERMGFGALRVINDDTIDPDSGFDLHPHNNMEIITIVTDGAITHGDSMGNEKTVHAGDVQVMSAGTGVMHSEQNNSIKETLHLYQIWIFPHTQNISPRYDQKTFGVNPSNTCQLLVSPDGQKESLKIYQNAFISRAKYDADTVHTYTPYNAKDNGVYILVSHGRMTIGDYELTDGDALGIYYPQSIIIQHQEETSYLIFEVPLQK